MADGDTSATGSSEPAPVAPPEADPLPTSVDVDLISHFERGAPGDGEER